MPAYIARPLPGWQPTLLVPGQTAYAFGSKSDRIPTTKFYVQKSGIASDVATLDVSLWEGNIPAVGQLITTLSLANIANVTNIALTGVTINNLTGIGSLTYALSGSNVTLAADPGVALVPVPEVAEVCSVKASTAFAVSGYGVSWAYTCPSQPGSLSIQLEGAIDNTSGSEFTLIGTAQTTASGYNEIFATLPENVNFVRLNITTASGGTSPTIIGKLLNSR
jgi:hypothetical protein